MVEEHLLKPPQEFAFPFSPYSIQHEFMSALYSTLEEGKLGIFESPTGTGKSLSIICGSLRWLYDHLARERNVLESQIQALKKKETQIEDEGDWISGQSQKLEAERERRKLEELLKLMTDKENEMKKMKERVKNKEGNTKELREFNKKSQLQKNDDDVLLDDEDLLLEDIEDGIKNECDSDNEIDNNKDEENYQGIQIIICSRTHSQLSQLVREVARSPYGDVRLIPLASRQSYCINSTVRKLNNLSLINEKCLDLQRGSKGRKTKVDDAGATVKKTKGSCSCPHMKVSQNITQLSEEALTTVQDVEALVDKGSKISACPYYATRAAVTNAQVLVVPYNTLLHKETREACGLRLKGSVVIIDEAHNLLDSIAQVYNAQVSGYQVGVDYLVRRGKIAPMSLISSWRVLLEHDSNKFKEIDGGKFKENELLTHAYSQLVQYRDKYMKRFSATNLLYLEQLIFVVGRLIHILGGKPGCPPNEGSARVVDTKLYSLGLFLLEAQIDNINQFRLIQFAQRSKLSHKLHGFTERYQPSVNITPKPAPQSGIRAFLKEISTKNNIPEPD
ncbi:DEAD H (Asp-Glu-Ala-Asp His) box helicase 11 [Homalodisca vitripennis]|nr:DEAD H (Asp-Glu-Ala-Asp His) box helicase 11 [Homalodisca vitripennis]